MIVKGTHYFRSENALSSVTILTLMAALLLILLVILIAYVLGILGPALKSTAGIAENITGYSH